MAGMPSSLPMLPPGGGAPGAMPGGPGSPPPGPAPSPVSAMAGARPAGGGGMSDKILQFLAGVGFQHFVSSLNKLKGGGKGDGKKSQAGGLLQNLAASRALPQSAVTPPANGNIPPMLAGGQGVPFTALLAQLAAAANKGTQ